MIRNAEGQLVDPIARYVSPSAIEETIIDALLIWARSGNQAPRSIGLSDGLFRRLESAMRERLPGSRALSDNESIVLQGPNGPVRIFKETE